MRAHLRYLRYVILHKLRVYQAGRRLGVSVWQLLVHDLSKFSRVEWGPYVASFYGPWKYSERPPEVVAAFDAAWLHHQHANPHHWQHWLLREDRPRARYWLQSPDCARDYVLVESNEFPRTEVYLPTLDINHPQPGADDRLRLVNCVVRDANRAPRVLPMPERYVREMVADWMGAGWVINKCADFPAAVAETRAWRAKQWEVMQLHPETDALVTSLLAAL
jgi:hypothetical protein